ncbi:hypothetical protein [Dyadobacter helix]|uniref:hypothetical protein n=1 Tax=Dyadobacter helix TaxID=2822344 RepID=UPI001BFC918F|nr:hypothetical protein [Dyadobacter sp. CECT 9275]
MAPIGFWSRKCCKRRETRVASNGVGLSNNLVKYAMLGQSMPQILELDGEFVVALPLIPATS